MLNSSFSSFLLRRLSRGGGGRRAGPHDGVGATQLGCEEVGGKHLKTKKNIGGFHVPRSPSLLARALKAFLRRHLRSYLEKEGRELIAQELEHAAQEQQQQHHVGFGGYFSIFFKKNLIWENVLLGVHRGRDRQLPRVLRNNSPNTTYAIHIQRQRNTKWIEWNAFTNPVFVVVKTKNVFLL